MQILILDDHSSIRALLVSLLSSEYKVFTGRDGQDGIRLLKKGLIPDLILLDIKMPNIDGYQFLDFISSSGIFKNIPVIILSACEQEELAARCYQKNVVDCISKPFNPIKLKQKIKQLLNSRFETNLS